MRLTWALCVMLIAMGSLEMLEAGPTSGFEVTNEQLRGAMLTLISSYNTLENNLERHEMRERALGETIKKALVTLQKGQRIFEPMRGTFARLDERISQMETLLIGRDTELKDQQSQTATSLVRLLDWIERQDAANQREQAEQQAINAQLLAAIVALKPPPVAPRSDSDDDDEADVGKKVDDLAESVRLLRREVAELMADRSSPHTVHSEQVAANAEIAAQLTGLEQKLTNFYVTGPLVATTTEAAQPSRSSDWEDKVATSLATIESSLRSVQQLPDREFFATLSNETLEAITDMRIEVLTASDKSFAKTATRIKDATGALDATIAEAVRALGEAGPASGGALVTPGPAGGDVERLVAGVAELRTEVGASLRQLEKLGAETGDNVLAVKRGMEYNVHAITLGIGEQIQLQVAAIDGTLREQFGLLNETMHANHNGALANLTAKIETEISQVWRQIGIMFNMMQSTEMSLNKLQEQTEIYVNGTSAVMDGMGGKVSQITDRMAEVDSNLNYLLGRLSLVTQEFNQIKTGLGAALDNIKKSFQSVQKQIQDVGPGPHNIENETDYNTVNDQPAAAAES